MGGKRKIVELLDELIVDSVQSCQGARAGGGGGRGYSTSLVRGYSCFFKQSQEQRCL